MGRGTFPEVPLTGLVFGSEFAYIAKETAKKRAAEKRAERKALAAEAVDDYEEDDDEGDYGAGFDYGGDDADDYGAGNAGVESLDAAFDNHMGTPNCKLFILGVCLGRVLDENC